MYILKGKGGAIMRSLEQCQSIVIGSRKDRNFSIAKEILVCLCVLFSASFLFSLFFYREDLQVSTITLSYYWDIFLALHIYYRCCNSSIILPKSHVLSGKELLLFYCICFGLENFHNDTKHQNG